MMATESHFLTIAMKITSSGINSGACLFAVCGVFGYESAFGLLFTAKSQEDANERQALII